jgi:hypothetical protein
MMAISMTQKCASLHSRNPPDRHPAAIADIPSSHRGPTSRPLLDDLRVQEASGELDAKTGIGGSVLGVEHRVGEVEGDPAFSRAELDARGYRPAPFPYVPAAVLLDHEDIFAFGCGRGRQVGGEPGQLAERSG